MRVMGSLMEKGAKRVEIGAAEGTGRETKRKTRKMRRKTRRSGQTVDGEKEEAEEEEKK